MLLAKTTLTIPTFGRKSNTSIMNGLEKAGCSHYSRERPMKFQTPLLTQPFIRIRQQKINLDIQLFTRDFTDSLYTCVEISKTNVESNVLDKIYRTLFAVPISYRSTLEAILLFDNLTQRCTQQNSDHIFLHKILDFRL